MVPTAARTRSIEGSACSRSSRAITTRRVSARAVPTGISSSTENCPASGVGIIWTSRRRASEAPPSRPSETSPRKASRWPSAQPRLRR